MHQLWIDLTVSSVGLDLVHPAEISGFLNQGCNTYCPKAWKNKPEWSQTATFMQIILWWLNIKTFLSWEKQHSKSKVQSTNMILHCQLLNSNMCERDHDMKHKHWLISTLSEHYEVHPPFMFVSDKQSASLLSTSWQSERRCYCQANRIQQSA